MKRILTLFLVLACAWIASGGPLDSGLPFGPSGAGGGTKFPLSPPLTVTPTSAEIATPGYSFALTATSPSSGAITYSSSDTDIATVSAAGLVTIRTTTGTADIIVSQAAVGEYFSAAQVTVPVVASWSFVPWDVSNVAIYCDGVDDLASASAAGLPATASARTIMFWCLDLATSSTGHKFMVYEGSPAGDTEGFGVGFYNSSPMISLYGNSAIWTYSRNQDWHHYAVAYPDDQGFASSTYYIDGIPIDFSSVYAGTNKKPATVVDGRSLQIGGFSKHSENAKGKYSEVAIFNYCLSSSEIQIYKPRRLLGSEQGLIRLYHCDEGSGTTLTDACGSGYNMTLIGGATWTTKL